MNLFDLKGRVALVTGASSGLGWRFANVLADHGADVAILARRLEKLTELKKEIEAKGVKCFAVQCDVTKEENVVSAVADVLKNMGKIDILVNNAGVAYSGNAEDVTGDDFRYVMDVNMNGAFYTAREVGKNMIKNQYGRIINIGSMFGLVGNTFSPTIAYHTSKGAITNFTKGLAAEWAKHRITVNDLAPGYFHSEMTDHLTSNQKFMDYVASSTCAGRLGNPEELDTALIFLSSDYSSYVTGTTISVDGGWTAI